MLNMWTILFALFASIAFSHAATTTNRFIVELAADEVKEPNLLHQKCTDLPQTPDNAINEIRNSFHGHGTAPSVTTTYTYNSPYLNGLSIAVDTATSTFTYDTLAHHIRSLRRIERVYPVRRLSLSPPITQNPARPPASGVAPPRSASNIHRFTGVAALHELGFRGKGSTIAVIDTGADYLNPFLSGGIGGDHRISYGYDLVGDNIRPPRVPVHDGDPYSECQAHGTHVAGIIGAVAPGLDLVGVAPEAKLEIYRVFDCEGITETDVVVDAVLRAAARRVDVINLSLGGGGPFEEGRFPLFNGLQEHWGEEGLWGIADGIADAVSAVLSRVNNNGTTYCVAAMGNDGRNGTFTSTAPSAGLDVPAIGSFVTTEGKTPGWLANYTVGTNATQNHFLWLPSDRSIFPLVLDLYVLTLNTTVEDDACAPLPPSTPNLANRLVLVRRGKCPFVKKMEHILAKGGKHVLIYNNRPGNDPFGVLEAANGTLGVAGMGGKDGLDLVRAFAATGRVQVTMNTTVYPTTVFITRNNQTAGQMSAFSSMGPPALGYIKPTVSAPGDLILSTVPRKDGYFSNLSGTSMATPYMSGIVALLKKARPELSFKQITTLLATTATPTQFGDGSNFSYPFLAPAWQQGGGLVSALRAYQCQTLLDKEAISFNDTAHFERELSFTVRNIDNQPQDYQLSNLPAVTAHPFRGNGDPNPIKFFANASAFIPNKEFTLSLTPDFASINVFPHTFSLAPGAAQRVTVSADISMFEGLRPKCPLFSGWIAINGTRDSLSLPWGAIGCSLYDLPVIDRNETLTHLVAATNETEYNATLKTTFALPRIEPNRVFTLPKSNDSVAQLGVVFPWLQYKFSMYTRFANIDLLSGNGSWVARLLDQNTTADAERVTVAFQNFTGLLPWGEWADEGQYRFNLSALRLYGNPNDTADYKEWVVSDPFIIRYQHENNTSL